MLSDLVKGILPPSWRRYTVPRGCTVIQWITDFSQRVKQLQEVSLLVSQGGAKELKVLCLKIQGVFKKRPNFCYKVFIAHFTAF
jgi:dynein heavy chain 1